MLTAAKSDRGRVANYIQQLDAYSPEDIAQQCIEVGMYEEAFLIHKKDKNHTEATNVLVDHVVSIDRAQEYADQVDLPEVWSKVAKAQLDGLRVTDSIESYIKAQDPSNYHEVIETATEAGKDEELIKYLRMARKTLREPPIDTSLAFSFARTNQLPELEEFLRSANVANIEESGDKAYAEGYHEAAKIFFSSISNWAKLATTLVHLEDYQAAVECARKANNVKVWKQVNEACVAKKEFRLAQICGLNLIVHAEELQDLVEQYERNGYFDELIAVLEAGLGLERGKSFLNGTHTYLTPTDVYPSPHGIIYPAWSNAFQVPPRACHGALAHFLVQAQYSKGPEGLRGCSSVARACLPLHSLR